MSVNVSSDEVMARFYEGVPVKKAMGRDETFFSSDKAKRMVGFRPRHSWRDVLEV